MYAARYRRIVFFFARTLISVIWWDLFLPRIGLRKWSTRTRPERLRRAAIAFRGLAIRMGGVLIKVGQFLSSRVDVLPSEITDELTDLQDEVPPEAFKDIRRVAEADLGGPLEQKYAFFDTLPLAAASLGQVHRARLFPEDALNDASRGEPTSPPVPGNPDSGPPPGSPPPPPPTVDVVVKVQRPDIDHIIEVDLRALRTVGAWLRRYKPIRRRANVPALLDEFSRTLYEEIDYLAEGHNAETFAANFRDHPCVRVPRVAWTHTTRRVLTLENVLAIKITDYDAITAAGISRKEVASRLLDTYLQQIFSDGFFHADPHPGNLFVSPLSDAAQDWPDGRCGWQLTFVDFGMVGRVPPSVKEGLRETLIGVGTRDPQRVVRSYQTLGILLPDTDIALLERASDKMFERFWGKNMTELTKEFTPQQALLFLDEFRELLYDLPFQLPQNLIFLGRAVSILSGMCTGLDPEFNLWDHLAPFARKLVAEEARAAPDVWLNELGNLARTLLSGPKRMEQVLGKLERGEIAVRAPEVRESARRVEGALRRVAGAVVFGALLLAGVQLYLGGEQTAGWVLFGAAGLVFFGMVLRR